MVLPTNSYFGDFQILFDLKSNLIYKTHEQPLNNDKHQEQLPDILFMCVEKKKIQQLCNLFPQTAENIKERARERRIRFMQQKSINSKKFNEWKKKMIEDHEDDGEVEQLSIDKKMEAKLAEYMTDEEPENQASQREDMKAFLNKMNGRIDVLVEALKKADGMIAKQKDHKSMIEQIKQKRINPGKDAISTSIAQFFKE